MAVTLRKYLNSKLKAKGLTLTQAKKNAGKYKSIAAAKKAGSLYYTDKNGNVMAAVYAEDLKKPLKPMKPKPRPGSTKSVLNIPDPGSEKNYQVRGAKNSFFFRSRPAWRTGWPNMPQRGLDFDSIFETKMPPKSTNKSKKPGRSGLSVSKVWLVRSFRPLGPLRLVSSRRLGRAGWLHSKSSRPGGGPSAS